MTNVAVPERLFIDTNVLVYASWPAAPLHRTARAALDSYAAAETTLIISRQVLREFLATLYRPSTGLTISDLADQVRSFTRRYLIVEDGPAITAQLLTLLESGATQIHDTNIAATCIAAGIGHILTNNPRDFARFSPQLIAVALTP